MLIKCPGCGTEVHEKALSCPKCGLPEPHKEALTDEIMAEIQAGWNAGKAAPAGAEPPSDASKLFRDGFQSGQLTRAEDAKRKQQGHSVARESAGSGCLILLGLVLVCLVALVAASSTLTAAAA
jgi:hypothetical protein